MNKFRIALDKNQNTVMKYPLRPISLYGRTSVEAETIVSKHSNYVSFRLATVFGYSYRMRTDLTSKQFC